MRRVTSTAFIATLLVLLVFRDAPAQPPAVATGTTIAFRNELTVPVIVVGSSVVNGVLRRGQPLIVRPGKLALDGNLPPGVRLYTIYDANQPSTVLLRNFPVQLRGQDLFLAIKASPTNPGRAVLAPDGGP